MNETTHYKERKQSKVRRAMAHVSAGILAELDRIAPAFFDDFTADSATLQRRIENRLLKDLETFLDDIEQPDTK